MARVGFVWMVLGVLFLLALIPAQESRLYRDGNTVWPLSRHYAYFHVMAMAEMAFVWIIMGLAVLACLVACGWVLLERAGWIKD